MCNVFWRELKGWLRAFTRTEIFLTILEAILLVIFIAFLVFVTAHLTVCPDREGSEPLKLGHEVGNTSDDAVTTFHSTPQVAAPSEVTICPADKCTWKPSHKTPALTHYFALTSPANTGQDQAYYMTATRPKHVQATESKKPTENIFEKFVHHSEQSDGEESDDVYKRSILALVKVRPGRDVIFGCTLTVVSRYWTLTAASCIEAIEEVDALDSFVMTEGGGAGGAGVARHAVADVRVHPHYRGGNNTRDLVALRSEDALLRGGDSAVPRAALLDHALLTLGERFTVLGFGRFRTVEASGGGGVRQLRQTHVHALPASQCPVPAADAWSLRHIVPGEPVRHDAAACGTAPLCAGVLFTRGTPCNYCAGTPLFRGPVLYGVMSDNQQCGVACEPAVYVNIATVKDWLLDVLAEQ